jgi:hypothetical protein
LKAIRKDDSGNVPRNALFKFRWGKDKAPAIEHAENKNEQVASSVANSTGQEKDAGVSSKMLEQDTVVKSSDHKTTVLKNDNEGKKGSNDDHTVTDEQDSCKKQASHKQSRRRAACNESARSRKMQRRRYHREQSANEEAETEAAPQLTKIKKVNFVMNSEGCFINGKPFDPRNPPDGIAIVVDQKSAVSEKKSKKRK